MFGDGKAQRPVNRVLDADARSDQDFGDRAAVVAYLERRGTAGQVEGIVNGAGESQRLAETAGTGGELARQFAVHQAAIHKIGNSQAPVRGHPFDSGYRLQGAQEHATCFSLDFATDVHAEITAINGINISVAGGAEEHPVSRSGPAMRVGGWIGRVVVRAHVRFDFDNSACDQARARKVRQQLAK